MKKTAVILILLAICALANAQSITLKRSNASVLELVQQIQKEYGYSFSIPSDLVDMQKTIPSVDITNASIEEMLNTIFSGQKVSFLINGKTIIVKKANPEKAGSNTSPKESTPASRDEKPRADAEPSKQQTVARAPQSQTRKISGQVLDENGEPLIGAGVICKGQDGGVITDIDGNFTIEAGPGVKEIEASFIGYDPDTLPADKGGTLRFKLQPSKNNTLEDVVVIGYGSTKKKDLTGSVAVVNMKDIDLTPATSIDQALQGKVAGMDIVAGSGDPSSSSSIRIRGSRSITASNEPLIVVNGVMDAVDDIKDLDPNDIKSVSVLKDASATAIYGSRGANGVIIITTKEGGGGKVNVSASVKFGVSMMARKLDLMNKEEFLAYRSDYRYMDAYIAGKTTPAPYDPSDYKYNTDWQDAITHAALYKSVNVSLNGSTNNKHWYYASVNYTDQDGIVRGSGFQRINAMFNTKSQFTSWLALRLSLTGSYRIEQPNRAVIGGTDNHGGAVYLAPVLGPYDNHNPLIENSAPFNTPVACIELSEWLRKKISNTDALTVIITPLKGLKIESQNSVNIFQQHEYRYWPSTMPKKTPNEGADAQRGENDNLGFATENTISYKTKVKKHNFDALAGFSAQQRSGNKMSVKAVGMVADYLKWNNLNAVTSKENYTVTSSSNKVVRESVYARFNYGYASKYYFTATARADGSSNFAKNNKWAFFPSAAIKWNMKNESWLKNQHWLDNLDLRASYGRTGNDALSSYSALQAYATTTDSYLFDGEQGASFYPVRVASENLTWEKTDMLNLAFETSMFHNRLKLTLEGYISKTSDLLLSVKTIMSTGYSSRYANLGATSNKGVELTIESKNIEKRNFGWTTTFALSHNRQMVENVGQEDYVATITAPSGFMMYGYKAGYPLNSLWGFDYGGVYQSKEDFDRNQITHTYAGQQSLTRDSCLGRPKYVDQDKDGVITTKDLIYLGNGDPVVYGGLQNDFYIKNFSISAYISYSIGGKIYNYSELYMTGGTTANQYKYMAASWHPEKNPTSNLPRAGHAQTTLPCSLLVHDASFLRLKNLTLAYRFDINRKWMKAVTVSVSGENLYLLSGYNGFDPDVSSETEDTVLRRVDLGSYPQARTIIAGVKLNF